MKIGFVRRGYSPTGGAEAYLRRLALGVKKEWHEPVLVGSREWPGNAWPNEFVIRVNGSSPLRFAREVERLASSVDVLFSLERIFGCDIYRAGDGVHAAWLDRRAAFESPFRRWTRWMNSKHRELLQLERCVFSREKTRMVIANSKMVRDEIVERYGYPTERIKIVANGYDAPPPVEGLREKRRAELGLAEGDFVALFAGSGWERKGLSVAVEATRQSMGVSLVVAGKGNAAPFAHVPSVQFIGPRSNLQADFAAADVFVLPTVYDPFSNACLEAQAAGLPVITTSANGFAEIMTEGVHGTTIAPGGVDALAQALQSWRAGGKAAAARDACRENAARYSVAENARQTIAAITLAKPQ